MKCYHFDEIHSTNSWAKENIPQWDRQGITLVTADKQTQGRGRFERHWLSPEEGNIYASFCFFIEQPSLDLAHLPQVLALAASYTLEELGFRPKLKWPNDIFLEGRKVAGILCESVVYGDQNAVVCGIGMNVNMKEESLKLVTQPAISLYALSGKQFVTGPILERIHQQFEPMLQQFLKTDFSVFLSQFVCRLLPQ